MEETLHFLVRYGYVVLFVFVVAEQVGVPLPAIPLLLGAGALARTGQLDLPLVIGLGVAAALLGDTIWYTIGRRRGAAVLKWLCRISLEPDSCVRRTERGFDRHGASALLFAKFVPGLSTAAPPLAGMLRMRLWRFLLYDGIGALLWIGLFTGLGYLLSEQLERVLGWATQLGGAVVVVVFGPLLLYLTWKYLQRRRALRELTVATITPETLWTRLEAGDEVTVVDMRHALEIESAPETIPTALCLPAEEFEERHKEIPRHHEVVLFCT
jgi:membrane protein DedA with SNARE-associated domain